MKASKTENCGLQRNRYEHPCLRNQETEKQRPFTDYI